MSNQIKNENLGAFAAVAMSGNDGYHQEGLTKREYFAGLAMQGFTANSDWAKSNTTMNDWDEYVDRISISSVEMADKLLLELSKSN